MKRDFEHACECECLLCNADEEVEESYKLCKKEDGTCLLCFQFLSWLRASPLSPRLNLCRNGNCQVYAKTLLSSHIDHVV